MCSCLFSIPFGDDGLNVHRAIVAQRGSQGVFELAGIDGGLLAALNENAWLAENIFFTLGVRLGNGGFDK